MAETPLDRIARALSGVVIGQSEGVDVTMSLSKRLEIAHIALSVLEPEMTHARGRGDEVQDGGSAQVLPAKFVTDAMVKIPDALPPDLT